jgi:uncharacterized protein (DUF1684 family)
MKANTVYYSNNAVAADVNSPAFNLNGGRYVLGAFGTFGGGTIKLQFTTDADSTWIDLGAQNGAATALSAAGTTAFYAAPGRYRIAIVGTTGPTLQVWFGDAQTGT